MARRAEQLRAPRREPTPRQSILMARSSPEALGTGAAHVVLLRPVGPVANRSPEAIHCANQNLPQPLRRENGWRACTQLNSHTQPQKRAASVSWQCTPIGLKRAVSASRISQTECASSHMKGPYSAAVTAQKTSPMTTQLQASPCGVGVLVLSMCASLPVTCGPHRGTVDLWVWSKRSSVAALNEPRATAH